MIYARPSKRVRRSGSFAPLADIIRRKVEISEEDDRRLEEAFPSVSLPANHLFARYEGYEQNDAKVLDLGFEQGSLNFTINHYNIERLASALRGGWHCWRNKFPVTLRFENVREINVVVDAEVGLYRKFRSGVRGLSKALDDIVALRCIGADPGFLRFHLEINVQSRKWIEVEPGCGIIPGVNLFVECERVAIIENLRQNWIDIIGADTLHLLDALGEKGHVQGWYMPDFDRFIQENT